MKFLTPRLLLPLLMLMAGCADGAKLTVVNRSNTELTNVVVSGTGFSEPLGSIPAGGQRQIRVHPSSETGLQLDFDADGRHFTTPREGYFENSRHYEITATVGPDFRLLVTNPQP